MSAALLPSLLPSFSHLEESSGNTGSGGEVLDGEAASSTSDNGRLGALNGRSVGGGAVVVRSGSGGDGADGGGDGDGLNAGGGVLDRAVGDGAGALSDGVSDVAADGRSGPLGDGLAGLGRDGGRARGGGRNSRRRADGTLGAGAHGRDGRAGDDGAAGSGRAARRSRAARSAAGVSGSVGDARADRGELLDAGAVVELSRDGSSSGGGAGEPLLAESGSLVLEASINHVAVAVVGLAVGVFPGDDSGGEDGNGSEGLHCECSVGVLLLVLC